VLTTPKLSAVMINEGLGFVVTSNAVKKLLVERKRRWYGLDLMLVSGSMAEALNVPQAGGFLIKNVVKDSIGGRLGPCVGESCRVLPRDHRQGGTRTDRGRLERV
jgi:hypothetical protein